MDYIYAKLAKGIFPQSFGSKSFAPVAGSLSIYNNQMQLEPASVAGRQILALHSQRQLRGVMNLQNLLTGLAMVLAPPIERTFRCVLFINDMATYPTLILFSLFR